MIDKPASAVMAASAVRHLSGFHFSSYLIPTLNFFKYSQDFLC